MSCNIYHLPFEHLLHIYNMLNFTDLLNVALVNKSFYDSVKEILWKTVDIPWASIAHDSFKSRQLLNLQYTVILRLSGSKDVVGRKCAWNSVRVNYRSLLDHLDWNKIRTLEVNGVIDDEGLEMACTTLRRLQSVTINRCKYISYGWIWLDSLVELESLTIDKCLINKDNVKDLVRRSKLQEIKLTRCVQITNEVFKYLTNVLQLRRLELVFSKKGFDEEYTYKNIASLLNLNELILKGLRITDDVMPDISSVKGLKTLVLDFDVNLVTENGLSHLSKLSALKRLSLPRCNHVSDSGFSSLTKLASLEYLNLTHCRKLSAIGLKHISSITTLTELNVSNCPVNDSGFVHICNMKNLRILNAFYCYNITDIGLTHIGQLANTLRTLYTGGRKKTLTHVGISHICELYQLRHLDLNCCNDFTDKGMAHLVRLKHLQTLNINNCTYISDKGLSCLSQLKCLKVLHACGLGKMTDQGLAAVCKLPLLRELNISYSSMISDYGLSFMSALEELRHLQMVHCSNVTDIGLAHLEGLTQLKYIDVSNCRNVTHEGVLHLCKLPHVREICLVDCSMVTVPELSDYPHIHFFGGNTD